SRAPTGRRAFDGVPTCSVRPIGETSAAGDNPTMSALRVGGREELLREPLECELPAPLAARCLHDEERPFALVGAWAGGGAVLGCSPIRVARDDANPFALI